MSSWKTENHSADITAVITTNLNRVIDRNFYPVEQARNSNMKHRPIGLGVQGLQKMMCSLQENCVITL